MRIVKGQKRLKRKLSEEEQKTLQLIKGQEKYFLGYGTGEKSCLSLDCIKKLENEFIIELSEWSIYTILFPVKPKHRFSVQVRVVRHPLTFQYYRLIESIRLRSRCNVEVELDEIIEILDEIKKAEIQKKKVKKELRELEGE